ncbi:MAG: hypothetical protein ACTSRZ_02905 [Promethearchaeota archaeon]
MAKKKIDYEEEDIEEDYDEFDDELEEIKFKCRVCGKEVTLEDGDDYLLLCDECAENYDVDKIWDDFDAGKIEEEELSKIDLEKYKL